MLGIILTGHGNFATGVGSDIELVAGPQEKFKTIDFAKGMTSEELYEAFISAMEELNADEGIVFLTDLAGGTPFNQAAMIKADNDNIGVIAGVNAPLIMEGLFNREMSVDQFVESSIENGKNGITKFQMKKKQEATNNDEGI
ncbi:PTS N-acetylgalactosamine IIA component [Companilactobacillus sp. RD055328]|uniref:PTS galactosamine/N-acetylgalactosamine transporter subunit IIA n=1 Tax=Companilactobacillus sp. RD055328 TaxID=2916634 RepID=UPI001FC7DCE2|nr:PTS galactosamine/N-acetylgalactosamine transporter subunit IIA [Companilactobacillus sp. RD055328]GKQ43261.1 PTS N-acetylgalactosamine IIA component [Companilactobacillus sp. RD055328]